MNKRELEALDEALEYLNENNNDKKNRISTMNKVKKAITEFMSQEGVTKAAFDIPSSVKLLGGAKANSGFKKGTSKYFIIYINPILDAQDMNAKEIDKVNQRDKDIGIEKAKSIISSKHKELEQFVSDKIDTKCKIKLGNDTKTHVPTIVITVD